MRTLAERLAWARAKKEMSQERLANLAGVSQSTIGNLEAGIRGSARKLPQIANALGVNALWLAEGIGDVSQGASKKNDRGAELIAPEDIVELVSLFGQTGVEGKKYILEAARSAAKEDPLPIRSTDKLELR